MYSGVPHIVLCVCFVFRRLVYTMMPFSLDCSFLIAPSVFSNVYLPLASTWGHSGFGFLVGFVLLINLDFFALFFFVQCYVPKVAYVSVLSILSCHFGFL